MSGPQCVGTPKAPPFLKNQITSSLPVSDGQKDRICCRWIISVWLPHFFFTHPWVDMVHGTASISRGRSHVDLLEKLRPIGGHEFIPLPVHVETSYGWGQPSLNLGSPACMLWQERAHWDGRGAFVFSERKTRSAAVSVRLHTSLEVSSERAWSELKYLAAHTNSPRITNLILESKCRSTLDACIRARSRPIDAAPCEKPNRPCGSGSREISATSCS